VRLRKDYADRIEQLAALNDRSPLDLLEWFLERSAIREHDGAQSRAEAEKGAIADLESWLS
jgi:hypothetical protein